MPTRADIARLLERRFEPGAAGDLDVAIELDWGNDSLHFVIRDGTLQMLDGGTEPEMVVRVDGDRLAHEIFSGAASPIEAFMAGRFRSDGYLVWVFRALGAFSRSE